MVGYAQHRELGPGDALHTFNGANREAFGLQHRALFHMQFHIGVNLWLASGRCSRVAYAPKTVAHTGAINARSG